MQMFCFNFVNVCTTSVRNILTYNDNCHFCAGLYFIAVMSVLESAILILIICINVQPHLNVISLFHQKQK